ncbi:efflux RND transporter permease subunit, partial [Bacillus licheniformis]|nr:efflux RND transporter permease subunit [Bacillus licheniformis]
PTLPEGLTITPLFDQSVFVNAAVQGVIHEALIAAVLTAMMILLFLGNWRSTLIIAISIPLSIFTSLIALSALGDAGKRLTGVIEDLAQVMLKVTGAVMWFAPVAVFAALASTITTEGLGILLTFAKFMASFYLALALLWAVL